MSSEPAATSRLDRWLAPRLATRARDTEREIAAQPTEVHLWRGGVDIRTLTVRVVTPGGGAPGRRGEGSESTAGTVTIVGEQGEDLRKGDRLQAEGGIVYLVTYVAPGQRWRVEAAAEVATR